jgi:putative flavoprotein involved in K+ transport
MPRVHSTQAPRDIADGPVLVVGGGNTGFQIAEELSVSHEVHLSIGSRQTPLPQRILGRDLFWYLEKTGRRKRRPQPAPSQTTPDSTVNPTTAK